MLISGATRVLGLIGDPIAQARTPGMANALLAREGKLGSHVLLPMQVSTEDLAVFVSGLRTMQNFQGAVITMPHKVNMASLVDKLTPEACLVGAVNVIRREADGTLVGTTLDGEGFVAGLNRAGHRIAGKSCVLVGAGGAASAIAFALAKYECGSLTIVNRTTEKAEALVSRLRQTFPALVVDTAIPADSRPDIAINGTRLGMASDDPLPMSETMLRRASLIADCVIAPEMTALLRLAESHGTPVHTGVPMLSAQMDLMLAFIDV